ncbi:hypothetical protein L1987_20163 [Smallanthus sonchifolius]|uniref:Uncharacterized protein n=1 Tax=Smallanthus sonchifolius TaxID=185202 RepID=A0ACB9IT49_9ASTR|nr:hypothetical protein L1987_20163 [Smallanthus sonchifolius]
MEAHKDAYPNELEGTSPLIKGLSTPEEVNHRPSLTAHPAEVSVETLTIHRPTRMERQPPPPKTMEEAMEMDEAFLRGKDTLQAREGRLKTDGGKSSSPQDTAPGHLTLIE